MGRTRVVAVPEGVNILRVPREKKPGHRHSHHRRGRQALIISPGDSQPVLSEAVAYTLYSSDDNEEVALQPVGSTDFGSKYERRSGRWRRGRSAQRGSHYTQGSSHYGSSRYGSARSHTHGSRQGSRYTSDRRVYESDVRSSRASTYDRRGRSSRGSEYRTRRHRSRSRPRERRRNVYILDELSSEGSDSLTPTSARVYDELTARYDDLLARVEREEAKLNSDVPHIEHRVEQLETRVARAVALASQSEGGEILSESLRMGTPPRGALRSSPAVRPNIGMSPLDAGGPQRIFRVGSASDEDVGPDALFALPPTSESDTTSEGTSETTTDSSDSSESESESTASSVEMTSDSDHYHGERRAFAAKKRRGDVESMRQEIAHDRHAFSRHTPKKGRHAEYARGREANVEHTPRGSKKKGGRDTENGGKVKRVRKNKPMTHARVMEGSSEA